MPNVRPGSADLGVFSRRSLLVSFRIRTLPRFTVGALGLIIATGLLTPLLIVLSVVTSGGTALAIERVWAWLVSKSMGLTFSCIGAEKVSPGTSYIITPNHQSNADILALISMLPVKFRWVVKKELLIIPLFGWALARTGAVPLNRKDRAESINKLQEAAGSKFRGGWSVLIYPEGTRSSDGNLQDFKKGAFMMAVQTGITILPVTCNGAFKVLPRDTIFFRPGHITLTFGDPIETAGLTVNDIPQLMEKTRQEMSRHFDREYDPFSGNTPQPH